jgi:hypothetical protein
MGSKILSVMRMMVARKRFIIIRTTIMIIQSRYRMRAVRRDYVVMKNGITKGTTPI